MDGATSRVLRGALLLLAAAATGTAPGGRQAQGQFRSGVELVEIPVIVRDRDGRLVTDLKQDDFQISEQGTAQTITAFGRISIPVSRGVITPSRPASAAVAPDVSSNEHVADARIFVLVLDAQHVAAQRSIVVRRLARQFIERHMGPTDLVAVVSPGGLESATQDFTTDKARLLAAIDRFAGSKLRSAAVELEEEKQALERGGVALHSGKDPSDDERALRAQALTSVLQALARHLDRIEHRRKALLLFSEGIEYDTMDVMGTVQRHASDVMHATERAIRALMRANVSVYAADPRGLNSAEGDLIETPLFRPTPSFVTGPSPEGDFARSIRTLRDVSEATGGFAAVDGNDADAAFARIVEESSHYYILGYVPARPVKPDEFREIAVRVSRPGVQVAARKGYGGPTAQQQAVRPEPSTEPSLPGVFSLPQRGRRSDSVAIEAPAPGRTPNASANDVRTLLASPLPLAGLPMRVHAIPSVADRSRGTVQVIVEVLGRGLQFARRDGRSRERIDLALLTVDSGGKAANGRSTRIDLRLTNEELQRVQATGVRWITRLELASGAYQLRVAAKAESTGTTGLVTADVDVPRLEPNRPALGAITMTSLASSLMITSGDNAADASPPSAARTFVLGDRLTAAFDVYAPASLATEWDLTAQVEFPNGSKSVLLEKKIAGGPGPLRKQPIAIPIDTSTLPVSPCVLRVMLGGAEARVERAIAFEVVDRARSGRR
jgi:VWFA-related protein